MTGMAEIGSLGETLHEALNFSRIDYLFNRIFD